MNLEDRIEELLDDLTCDVVNAESGQLSTPGHTREFNPEYIELTKQLVRDVLAYVKPYDRRDNESFEFLSGFDTAVDQIEARTKELIK